MADRVPETRVLEVPWRNGFNAEQCFSSVFAKLLAYFMIFQRAKVLRKFRKIIKYGKQKFGINEEKTCSICIKPILWVISGTPKIRFRVHTRSVTILSSSIKIMFHINKTVLFVNSKTVCETN